MNRNSRSNDDALRARAISPREAGWSNPRIRAELGISGWKLTQLFQGHVEPVHENLANRAKSELRVQARDLREQGWSYNAIARKLRVSKSSLSLWLRDLPKPEIYQPGEPPAGSRMSPEEWADFCVQRHELYRKRRAKERRRTVLEAVEDVGDLSGRELLIAGAMIYWCEGAKTKPWRRQNAVVLINSDACLIDLYLRFLDHVGYGIGQLRFVLHIHEDADAEAATAYWMDVTGATREQFRKPVIKRHNPRTVRKRVGDHYHGALLVYVRKSAALYLRIDGWARAVMLGRKAAIASIESAEEPPW